MRLLAFLAMSVLGCAARNKQSVSLYEAGDYAGAARAADSGLAGHPDDEGLWQMRIRAAIALGDGDAAAKAYTGYAATTRPGELDKDLLRDLAVATLGQALASPVARDKVMAIDAIAAAELHALSDQVADHLTDEAEVVAAAASAAVLRGYPKAPEVADQMLHAKDPAARRIAVDAVGKKVGRLALADLEKAGSDRDAGVRRIAVRWLGQLKDLDAHELLLKRLRDPDEGVRAAAATALARVGIGNLADFAKRALDDRALAVRLAAIDLLVAARRDDELVMLVDDKAPMVALAAAIELHATHPELGDKALSRALASEDWTMRAGAANQAVRAVGKAAAKTYADKLATDAEPGVRLAAARVLAQTGDRAAAIAVLVPMLDAADRGVQAAADLADLGDARGEVALAIAIRDPKRTPELRAAAAYAHRSAHAVTGGLIAALTDQSPEVRIAAAATLAILTK